jgi:hypothetical protein
MYIFVCTVHTPYVYKALPHFNKAFGRENDSWPDNDTRNWRRWRNGARLADLAVNELRNRPSVLVQVYIAHGAALVAGRAHLTAEEELCTYTEVCGTCTS